VLASSLLHILDMPLLLKTQLPNMNIAGMNTFEAIFPETWVMQ
jgi:hypothetical protein